MTLQVIRSKPLENALAANWYVVQTHVKQEMVAKLRLIAQGFEVFLPQYKKPGPKGKGELILPLFTGYLFTSFDIAACRWQLIHSTIGVSRILGYNSETNTICPVKHGVIPGFQAFCDANDIVDMAKAFPASCPDEGENVQYEQGDAVEILSGMFKGQQATYWNRSKVGTHVILSLLNRSVRVILRNEEITKGC